ncbi:TolC family protein [bacterium]|nr:TolC family protein [bacterium]
MKHLAKISLVLFVYCISGDTFAQTQSKSDQGAKKITLNTAIESAMQNAPQLEISEQELAMRQAQHNRAKSNMILPEFEINILTGVVPDLPEGFGPENDFPDYNANLKGLGPFIRSKLTFIQPVYLFNRLNNLKKAARNGVLSAEEGLKAKQNEIIEQVQTVYWTHVYLQNLKDFIAELLDRANQAKDRVIERLDSGSGEVTDIDLMRIKVFINETKRRAADAQRGLDVAEYSLKLLMGLDSQQKIKIVDSKLPKPKLDLQSSEYYLARAKVARPEMQQLEKAVLAQKHLMLSKKAEFFPNIFIAGQWELSDAPGRAAFSNPYINDGFNRNIFGASFGIRQNLSFHNIATEYKEEKIKLKLAQSRANLALQGIELEIRDKYLNLKAKKQAYDSSTQALKSARSWVLSTTLNFGAGLMDARELLESFVGYASVKTSFFDVLYNYHKARFALRRAIGEDLLIEKNN